MQDRTLALNEAHGNRVQSSVVEHALKCKVCSIQRNHIRVRGNITERDPLCVCLKSNMTHSLDPSLVHLPTLLGRVIKQVIYCSHSELPTVIASVFRLFGLVRNTAQKTSTDSYMLLLLLHVGVTLSYYSLCICTHTNHVQYSVLLASAPYPQCTFSPSLYIHVPRPQYVQPPPAASPVCEGPLHVRP